MNKKKIFSFLVFFILLFLFIGNSLSFFAKKDTIATNSINNVEKNSALQPRLADDRRFALGNDVLTGWGLSDGDTLSLGAFNKNNKSYTIYKGSDNPNVHATQTTQLNLGLPFTYTLPDDTTPILWDKVDVLMQYSFYNYDVPNIQVINVYNCSGLGKLVFNNLSTLKVVTFDEHITFLGGSSTGNPAFKNCNNIEYISFKSTTPPTLYSNNEFSGAKQIFVPGSALNTYKNNNYFKRFASKIFAFPESISVSPLAPQLFNYGTSGASDEITIQVVPSEAEQAYSCFIDKPDGSAAPNWVSFLKSDNKIHVNNNASVGKYIFRLNFTAIVPTTTASINVVIWIIPNLSLSYTTDYYFVPTVGSSGDWDNNFSFSMPQPFSQSDYEVLSYNFDSSTTIPSWLSINQSNGIVSWTNQSIATTVNFKITSIIKIKFDDNNSKNITLSTNNLNIVFSTFQITSNLTNVLLVKSKLTNSINLNCTWQIPPSNPRVTWSVLGVDSSIPDGIQFNINPSPDTLTSTLVYQTSEAAIQNFVNTKISYFQICIRAVWQQDVSIYTDYFINFYIPWIKITSSLNGSYEFGYIYTKSKFHKQFTYDRMYFPSSSSVTSDFKTLDKTGCPPGDLSWLDIDQTGWISWLYPDDEDDEKIYTFKALANLSITLDNISYNLTNYDTVTANLVLGEIKLKTKENVFYIRNSEHDGHISLDYIINFLPNISLYTNYYFYVSEPLEMQWLKIINIYDENINDWKIGTIFWEEKPTTGNFRINILVEELYTKYISNYITLNIIVSDVESFTILFALEFSFIITIIFTSVIFLYFHRVKSRNSSILSSKKNEK